MGPYCQFLARPSLSQWWTPCAPVLRLPVRALPRATSAEGRLLPLVRLLPFLLSLPLSQERVIVTVEAPRRVRACFALRQHARVCVYVCRRSFEMLRLLFASSFCVPHCASSVVLTTHHTLPRQPSSQPPTSPTSSATTTLRLSLPEALVSTSPPAQQAVGALAAAAPSPAPTLRSWLRRCRWLCRQQLPAWGLQFPQGLAWWGWRYARAHGRRRRSQPRRTGSSLHARLGQRRRRREEGDSTHARTMPCILQNKSGAIPLFAPLVACTRAITARSDRWEPPRRGGRRRRREVPRRRDSPHCTFIGADDEHLVVALGKAASLLPLFSFAFPSSLPLFPSPLRLLLPHVSTGSSIEPNCPLPRAIEDLFPNNSCPVLCSAAEFLLAVPGPTRWAIQSPASLPWPSTLHSLPRRWECSAPHRHTVCTGVPSMHDFSLE